MVPALGLVVVTGIEPTFVLETESDRKDAKEVFGEGVAVAREAFNVGCPLFVERDHRKTVVLVELAMESNVR